MKKVSLILLLLLTIISCKKAEKTSKLIDANWLIGTWENNSKQGNLSEIWLKLNDSIYSGHVFFIKGKDTLHFETIQLKQVDDNLRYSSTVKGQNNDLALEFKLTSETKNKLIFENSKNDYPQKITYKLISKDSLITIISGIQQGKASTENFPMKRNK